MSTLRSSAAPPPGLPLVLQLGFAGSRLLFDHSANPELDAAAFGNEVEQQLAALLKRLPTELRMTDHHFVCGISSLAIGADTIFTRVCRKLGWCQRLLLPQQREDFLRGAGSCHRRDFTKSERAAARELFSSPHVIQERVVSDSPDRHTRFHDVNLELVRVSDVLVCLTQAAAAGKPGGTREVLENAIQQGRPVLEIVVSIRPGGQAHLTPSWHNLDASFMPPALPGEFSALAADLTGIPTLEDFCKPLKAFASQQSRLQRTIFKTGALAIIGTHVLATAGAVLALKLHGAAALPWVLGGELLLLALGFAIHQYLHLSHSTRVWAMARLAAEVARSGLALREVSGYLTHLFTLPMPASLSPLLRTLNVLHLRETRKLSAIGWAARSQAYVQSRLRDRERGQIRYYFRELRAATRQHTLARRTFFAGSLGAITATMGKLLLICDCLPVPHSVHNGWAALLGVLAILLPVVAVAALSLAASFDLEARLHTYREMLAFLRAQRRHLRHAPSERAFSALALETEAKLVGETVAWYSRRAFTGVA